MVMAKDGEVAHSFQPLMGVSRSFFWGLMEAKWPIRRSRPPIRIKKHKRPAKSVFRYGFDRIRNNLLNPQDKQEELHEILMLLWNVLMGPKHHIYQLYPLF